MSMVSERIRRLRESLKVPQAKMAEMLGSNQASVNRWEHGQAEPPQRVLLWYADFFNVSLDYIFGRCAEPQGLLYDCKPDALRMRFARQEEWEEFIEACFDPTSPLNSKLKDMILQLAGGKA